MDSTETTGQRFVRRFKFCQAVLSDVGLKREENQDSYGFAHTDQISFYVVADGMGGARGGGTASLLAVNSVLRGAFSEIGEVSEESIRLALVHANDVIFSRSKEDDALTGMGTTIVILALIGDRAIVAHVGDSRIYFMRSGKLEQLTRDHTLVQELVDSGAIKPEEAAHHPIAHMLTRSLGPTASVQPDVVTLPFPILPGDRFLLCSDGLYNLVDDAEIGEALECADIEQGIQGLLNKVLERGASDNCTIEAIRVHELNDPAVDAGIPEEGKIRVVTSGDLPDGEDLDARLAAARARVEQPETEFEDAEDEAETEEVPEPKVYDPVESLIFSNSPTSEDVRKSESGEGKKRKKRILEQHEKANGVAASEVKVGSEEEAPNGEAHDEPTAEEIAFQQAENKKLQLAAGAVVSFTLAILLFVYLKLSPSKEIVAANSSTVEQNIISQRPPVVPVEQQKDDSNSELPSAGPTITTSVSPVNTQLPDTAQGFGQALKTIPSQGANLSSGTLAGLNGGAKVSDQKTERGGVVGGGWPSVDVASSIDVAKSTTVTTMPVVVTTLPVRAEPDEGVKEVLALAGNLSIPVAPKIRHSGTSGATAPIDWTKEQERKKEVVDPNLTSSSRPADAAPAILSDSEKIQLVQRKLDLRESIADTDFKIAALSAATEDEVKARKEELENQLRSAQRAIDVARNELDENRQQFKRWIQYRKDLQTKFSISLAKEIALFDGEVKRKAEELEEILLQYRDAVNSWQSAPQNMDLVSKMSALSREQKSRQAVLEDVAKNAVESKLHEAEQRVVESSLQVEDIGRLVQRFNRHVGLLKLVRPNEGGRNDALLDKAANDRQRLADEFDSANLRFSEYAETETRRGNSAAQLKR